MANKLCASCAFRGRYERNPRSFLGRLWRWHTKFCPGWKMYMNSLADAERAAVNEKLAERDKQQIA